VSDLPGCGDKPDFRCNLMRNIARRGVYTEYVRKHVIQAQYYKDPQNYEGKWGKRLNSQCQPGSSCANLVYPPFIVYLEKNIFLPDINNEYPIRKNKTYKANLLSLNKLVLIKFAEDETVRPAESAVIRNIS
jgi:palmitoyl-protein thioesterase